MSKTVSEDDFVNEGLTDDERTALDSGTEPDIQDDPDPEIEASGGSEDAEDKPAAADPNKPEPPQMVDVRAVQEARAENRALKEKYAILEDRTNTMLAMMSKGKQDEPKQDEPPDPNEDVFAALKWTQDQLRKQQEAAQQRDTQHQQRQQADQHVAQAFHQLDASLNNARSTVADIDEASNWLYDMRMGQLKAQGANDFEAQTAIKQEIYAGIVHALDLGRDPAQYFYEYAKTSGYAGPKPKPAQGGPENIRRMAEQQERHRSLSDASGGEPPKALDAKALANMSDAAFQKLMSDPSKAAEIDRIMGIA